MKLDAIHHAYEGTERLKCKGEPLAKGQDGKKKPFKPNSNSVPKIYKESWWKIKEFSKKFCKCCEDYGGTKNTHNTKEYRKYDCKGTLLESYGKSKPNGGDCTNQKPRGNFDLRSFAQTLGKEIVEISHHIKERAWEHGRYHRHDVSASDNSSSF